jgi:hypothetical protein
VNTKTHVNIVVRPPYSISHISGTRTVRCQDRWCVFRDESCMMRHPTVQLRFPPGSRSAVTVGTGLFPPTAVIKVIRFLFHFSLTIRRRTRCHLRTLFMPVDVSLTVFRIITLMRSPRSFPLVPLDDGASAYLCVCRKVKVPPSPDFITLIFLDPVHGTPT